MDPQNHQTQADMKAWTALTDALKALRESKPGDGSERPSVPAGLSRWYAITITDVEKAFAYFTTYVMMNGEKTAVEGADP